MIIILCSNLRELIDLYSAGTHQKTYGFLMNLRGIEVNKFTYIRLILDPTFGVDS